MAKTYDRWKATGRTVGTGGQSHVYLVEDTSGELQGRYALKRLKRVESAQARLRFKAEVEATQRIEHANVLKIYDFDVEAAEPYYVAEYCEGESLQKNGAERFMGNMDSALQTFFPVLDALVAVHHAGVIHRDVKPPNVLFRKDGTPVVGDFGICYIEGTEHVTFSDEAVGSRHYLAPELEAGNHGLGAASDKTDVYSLGKLLYWMLSGGRRFDRENHRGASLVEMLGDQRFEHVHILLDSMIAFDPKQRLKSDAVKAELRKVASLVSGNYAPLKPSIGISCRFCGIGKYERWAVFDSGDPKNNVGTISKLGLVNYQGAHFRILRCSQCGHVEFFQFEGITVPHWWKA
jgi:serine/threonine protein kinase